MVLLVCKIIRIIGLSGFKPFDPLPWGIYAAVEIHWPFAMTTISEKNTTESRFCRISDWVFIIKIKIMSTKKWNYAYIVVDLKRYIDKTQKILNFLHLEESLDVRIPMESSPCFQQFSHWNWYRWAETHPRVDLSSMNQMYCPVYKTV